MKKILAALLAMALVLAFTACNKNPGDDTTTTTTETTTEGETTPVDGTVDPTANPTEPVTDPDTGETVTNPGTDDPTGTTGTDTPGTNPTGGTSPSGGTGTTGTTTTPPPGGGVTVPGANDTAAIIAYYNSGLSKTSSIKRTAYTRTLAKCNVDAGSIYKGDLSNDESLKNRVNINEKKTVNSDLVQLNAGMVKSANCSVQGDTVTLNITLKDVQTTSPTPSKDGYLGSLSYATTASLIEEVAVSLAASLIKSCTVQSIDFKMTDGKMTVTLDKNTGKIKTASYSGYQGGVGKAKVQSKILISVNATADIGAKFTATYAG